jgi:hydroxypyruvate isomerase
MAQIHRRKLLKQLAAGSMAAVSLPSLAATCSSSSSTTEMTLKNNINHSVCHWTYNFLSLDELCATVKKIGFSAIDLVGPKDWPTLKKHGVYSSMCNGAEINLVDGGNQKELNSTLIKIYK